MGYVHRFATGSRLSGLAPRANCVNVAVAVNCIIVKLVNVHQEINLSGYPRFRVHESTMVQNLAVLDGLYLCYQFCRLF